MIHININVPLYICIYSGTFLFILHTYICNIHTHTSLYICVCVCYLRMYVYCKTNDVHCHGSISVIIYCLTCFILPWQIKSFIIVIHACILCNVDCLLEFHMFFLLHVYVTLV